MNKEENMAKDAIHNMSIKASGSGQLVRNLSGGNQQKVSLSKSLMTKPKILILDEPTRGVDVGAKKEIYDIMNQFKKDGMSIMMISSEIPEILGMSDRILVMHEGRISGSLDRKEANQENIMRLAVEEKEVSL
jgi:ribose transport system ATP-binding protein